MLCVITFSTSLPLFGQLSRQRTRDRNSEFGEQVIKPELPFLLHCMAPLGKMRTTIDRQTVSHLVMKEGRKEGRKEGK